MSMLHHRRVSVVPLVKRLRGITASGGAAHARRALTHWNSRTSVGVQQKHNCLPPNSTTIPLTLTHLPLSHSRLSFPSSSPICWMHRSTTLTVADNSEKSTPHRTADATAPSQHEFIAVQYLGRGRELHFSVSPPSHVDFSSSIPLTRVHRSEADRRREAEQSEKQQLLRALFSSYGSKTNDELDGSHVKFSKRWYPVADLLMLLLPQHYPDSVNKYYLTYSKWVFLGSILGTASSVLSMQCLLYSLGLGAAALPTSAAINWVLKDGLGQFGGMLFASLVSTRFDIQPIRFRMLSAIVLDASVLLEILTPLVPSLFLPLASIANIGKNVAWLGASASRAAIHRSFLRRENLADVTAKSGSQTILASLAGTALGISLSMLTGNNTAALLTAFVVLSAGHIMATYRAVSRIVLSHITERRLDQLSVEYLRRYQSLSVKAAADASSPTALLSKHLLLTPPETLQQTEPILWRGKGVSPSEGGFLPDWSGSSVDFMPRFERMVQSLIRHPHIILNDAVKASSSSAQQPFPPSSPSSLYAAWLAEFAQVPFVAMLSISRDAQAIQKWNHGPSLFQRMRNKFNAFRRKAESEQLINDDEAEDESDIEASSSALAASGHLRIELLFKSEATPEDILQASLYTSYLRTQWQELLPNNSYTQSELEFKVAQMHREALSLIEQDTLLNTISNNAHGSTSAQQTPLLSTSRTSSMFVSALRASGYAINNHFVQDHNNNRIHLEKPQSK